MKENKTPLLRIENVSVSFPVKKDYPFQKKRYVRAVSNISMEIYPGETFGLVGESGCGKSTLANTTLGIQPVDSGKIFYKNEELTAMNRKQLKNIRSDMQMIFQDPFSSLNPRFSIYDIIAEPMRITGKYTEKQMREEVEQKLREVGLSKDDMNRFPSDFSGGQKQRIGIARALILKPKYLVCDEPVSALDVSVHAQILNLLMDLQEKYHITYLLISHNLAVVKRICSRLLVMYCGKAMEYGNVNKIFLNPAHPYTRALMSAVFDTDMDGKKKRIILKGEVPSPINPPHGCKFSDRCPEAQTRCKLYEPPLMQIDDDHYIACLRYKFKNIEVDDKTGTYISCGNCLIEKAANTLVLGCGNSKIPDSVTNIAAGAFMDCRDLTEIFIPASVKKIGADAFLGCDKLIIRCRAEKQPDGWDKAWNSSNLPVQWNCKQ